LSLFLSEPSISK